MAKSSLITGLDIGTSSIKIAVAQKRPEEENLEITYAASQPSRGVRRGVVVDAEAAAKCIGETLRAAQLAMGHNLEEVYISVNGGHIFAPGRMDWFRFPAPTAVFPPKMLTASCRRPEQFPCLQTRRLLIFIRANSRWTESPASKMPWE
jgi:Actin-like ATPase involved in cell division